MTVYTCKSKQRLVSQMFVVDKKLIVVEGQVHNSWNTWYCFSDVSEHYLKKASLVYLVPTELYKQLLLFICILCCVIVSKLGNIKQLVMVGDLGEIHASYRATTRSTCFTEAALLLRAIYYIAFNIWRQLADRPDNSSSITRYFSPQSTEAIQSLSWVDQSTYITS